MAQDRIPLERTCTVSLSGGFADTFQLILGGMYGEGPSLQDRLSVSVNNAFRNGDSVTAFGWSATDMPSARPSWMAGLLYKSTVLKRKNHALNATAGLQRWVLPIVKTGAKDWLLTGNATYSTAVKRVPIFVTGDSWTLLKSTLPLGSAVYWQAYTQHTLWKGKRGQLLLRHGPAYTYSWSIYGAEGHRVFRYCGSLVASSKIGTLEAGYRQQMGLQAPIPNNRYWYWTFTRQITMPLSRAAK